MTEYITNIENLLGIPSGELTWFIIGFGGQFLFMMRFVIQWWYSEKAKQVVIPVAFWYCSIFGSLTFLIYAVHCKDSVFFFGQSLPLIIYLRNLYLHFYGRRNTSTNKQ